jgi:alanine racemase
MEMAQALSTAAVSMGKQARVHVKVDTGLGRLGVEPEEAVEFASSIAGLSGIKVEGVFSHLSAADADPVFSSHQFSVFQRVCSELEAAGRKGLTRHIANSAATLRHPEMHLDLVRPGLLVYGLSSVAQPPIPLRPALTWKARIYFVKRLAAGRRVSYAGTYVTRRATNVAVVLAGYADGYARALSNRASALVRGKRRPVAGRICMDQFLLDAGDDPVGVGEEVVLIGRQGTEEITANQVAAWRGTSVYEVVTCVNKRVPRVYLGTE